MDDKWIKIEMIAEVNNGIIRTKDVEDEGIGRIILKKYVDEGKLCREMQGIYTVVNNEVDEYELLKKRCSCCIYSYGTALFFHGLSDRVPHTLSITVPQGYNVSRIKKANANTRFHYVKKELLEIGVMEMVLNQGGNIRLYDQERCICDLIRNKQDVDLQIYIQGIKDYFQSGNINVRKLIQYGKQFGIEDKIRTYMEVLI